jgi:adenylate cyclase
MLRIIVSNKAQHQQHDHRGGPLELGRGPRRQAERIVIDDPYVSNDQIRIEELADSSVRMENLSRRNSLVLADGTAIEPGGSRELHTPIRLTVGESLVELVRPEAYSVERKSLRTIEAPFRPAAGVEVRAAPFRLGPSPTVETLGHWFETVIGVQRAAAGSIAFYEQTARAVVELVGLDRGLVLLRRNGNWQVVAYHSTSADSEAEFSHTILRQVVEERRTFFQPPESHAAPGSLLGIEAVVASPIFDAGDTVIGAVYGSRTRGAEQKGPGVQPLEAQLVQLLAAAVGVGLARLEHEAEAARARVQFEQFFTPELARELERDPALLEGREREITILFSDIRGFSRIAERVGPRETCRLVSEIMQRLTTRIREHAGVVVDYIGDAVLAIWNAPADQPEHATLACRAALAMIDEIPGFNAEWQELLGGPLGLGIGVNTGMALVGNTGSRHKFKYGPLGHAVNLASRIEGATKQFGVPILLSGATHARIGRNFATRRLCRLRVVGIGEPVDVYELHAEMTTLVPGGPAGDSALDNLAEWLVRRDAYESALLHFEAGRWSEASQELLALVPAQGDRRDVPSSTLASRALELMKSPPAEFDPVLKLDSK